MGSLVAHLVVAVDVGYVSVRESERERELPDDRVHYQRQQGEMIITVTFTEINLKCCSIELFNLLPMTLPRYQPSR